MNVSAVPNDGCLNFVDENDEVLLAGFGRKGKAKGDIPGVRFKGWSNSVLNSAECSLTPTSCQGFWCRSARSLEGEEGEAEIIDAGRRENGTVRHAESARLVLHWHSITRLGNLDICGRHGLKIERSSSRRANRSCLGMAFCNDVLSFSTEPWGWVYTKRLWYMGSMIQAPKQARYITRLPRHLARHTAQDSLPPGPE